MTLRAPGKNYLLPPGALFIYVVFSFRSFTALLVTEKTGFENSFNKKADIFNQKPITVEIPIGRFT
jgi:hypothetical protein